MKDFMKIVTSLNELGFDMLLGTLAASLLENMLIGKVKIPE